MTDDAPGPPLGELRAASASLMADRLRDDLEARLSTTRRGRLALRLARRTPRRRKMTP